MAIEVEGLDVALLRSEIQRTYADVSTQPDREFIFPTGRAWALDLGYPQDLLARVPKASCESFAGVANPFSMGALQPGEHVLVRVQRVSASEPADFDFDLTLQ